MLNSMLPKFGLAAAMLCALCAAPLSARAQTFQLSPVALDALPGEQLVLLATLTNNSGQTIFLDGSSGNITGPGASDLTFDDTDFLNNLPISMLDTETYQSNLLVNVVGAAQLGVYTATYSVEGHTDVAGVITNFSTPDAAQITVQAANSVPEPGTLALLLSGTAGMASLTAHRRRSRRL